jgi:hypothetical protein
MPSIIGIIVILVACVLGVAGYKLSLAYTATNPTARTTEKRDGTIKAVASACKAGTGIGCKATVDMGDGTTKDVIYFDTTPSVGSKVTYWYTTHSRGEVTYEDIEPKLGDGRLDYIPIATSATVAVLLVIGFMI